MILPPLLAPVFSLLLLVLPVQAAQEFLLPASAGPERKLVIYSATDYLHLEPLLQHFQQEHPRLSIRLLDLNTQELHDRFLTEGPDSPADLLISSAMDLQLKLVNDGHARPWRSNQTLALPAEAHWRHELFAFTFEPVLTVFNRTLLGPHPVPRSRQELLTLLRRDPARFAGRIATYDIVSSGVGYLLASQDSQQGLMYGRLLEAFGSLAVHLDDTSNGMLESLARGNMVIGYNLLGSYVSSALARYPQLEALAPEDYTLMLMRLALIPNSAPHPTAAGELIDFMLSARGQALLAQSGLHPLLEPDSDQLRLAVQAQGPITLIPLTPALLPLQDRLARKHFIDTWTHSIAAPNAAP
ncbi:ABC-type Fe3+ transport system substrate-binding protein [Oceanisphaera litoralis]|uniref:ABC transporter substrate-binding protein n=1 Tax=Oceanisphaera litoralis TaxID=225144 RepID=UPI00195D174A|nr:ABC transporter substrate-binding protein [Oceanisphaera litoralis]MBM7455357.1 ABC-type Fe3+ transport system substrate-binding protein [Oceanisphaera litoralis]